MTPDAESRAAVIGHPIGHSKSPLLHRAAYAELGVSMDYSAHDLTADQLEAFVHGVRSEEGWRGLSVTMPHKAALIPFVDRLAGLALEVGALNTVVVERPAEGAAVLVGHNTDVIGIVEAFRHAGVVQVAAPAVVGAGNTALAAVSALRRLGASRVAFIVRDASRAGEAVGLAERLGLEVEVVPMDGGAARLAAADAVVCTLPPRAADALAGELAGEPPTDDGAPRVLLDVAYDPWPSAIARVWQERGGRVLHGLEMLVYQAVEQIVLFTGRQDARSARVIDVMCDAVGVPRRL